MFAKLNRQNGISTIGHGKLDHLDKSIFICFFLFIDSVLLPLFYT